MMKAIDLFCGCGGLSLGFQNAGFQIEAAFDNWKPALEVYRRNFSHQVFDLELSANTDLETLKTFAPDIIIGGAPCQDFSSAGKRDENLGRADLTLTFAEIVTKIRPRWFVMENVERITKSLILKDCLKIYESAGYGLTAQTLDASFCSVPQTRKRFFLIGHLFSDNGFLRHHLRQHLATRPMTVFDYFGANLDTEFYYRHPRSYQRRGIYSVHEPSPTIRGVNRPIPKTYVKHAQDACEPNAKVRPLTTIERARLQTFPEDFEFFGGKTDLEQMIGNAVPVKLAEYVARCVRDYENDFQNGKVNSSEQLKLKF